MSDAPSIAPAAFLPDGRPAPFLLTREELAEFLRLAPETGAKTIRLYRERAGLKAVQVGKHIRFRLDDVMRFLDQQQERNPR